MPHAFLLHLTPTQKLPKHPYLSQYTHGLFYHLLQTLDPALSAEVHAQKRNPFSLWAKEQKDSSVMLRVSLLDDSLFQPLIRVVLTESLAGLELGQDQYRVARVLATPEGHRDANYESWQDILCAKPTTSLQFHFFSPTVFSTSKLGGAKQHYTPLPDPKLMLQSLFKTFQLYSPIPYSKEETTGLEHAFENLFIVTRHDIRTELALAGKTRLTGFVGKANIRYQDSAITVKKALAQLGKLAFYSGLGAKTPYGMGQVRVSLGEDRS
ncbi:MAG: CRISPR-associated endoribonuclease Cas6 [Trueperaceae bacterium]|nr:CRISPR-associated endoribonuclease Cas6 [Trueperaceae bacterium]